MIKKWSDYDIVNAREPNQSTPFEFPVLGKKINAPGEISRLNNSIHYYLQYVFIMTVEKGFHLVVIHHNRVELEKVFKSSKKKPGKKMYRPNGALSMIRINTGSWRKIKSCCGTGPHFPLLRI